MSRRTGARYVVSAVLVLTSLPGVAVASSPPSTASPAGPGSTGSTGPGSPALGPAGLTVQVDALEREDDGVLRVVATVANRGDEPAQTFAALRSYTAPGSTLGLAVLDPATGRLGQPVGEQGTLPLRLEPGEAASVVVPVHDPGGDVVDVVFTAFHPVTRLAVDGEATAEAAADGDVSTLRARSVTPAPRKEVQAAEVVGGDLINLDTSVLFALDSAALSAKAAATLDAAASTLKQQDGRRIAVVGHTDSQGDEGYNQKLSLRRAEAVEAGLAQRLGAGWTLEVSGKGETEPVAPEVDAGGAPYPEGQARNRRVELRVLG